MTEKLEPMNNNEGEQMSPKTETTKAALKRLASEGLSYDEIATKLNESGHTTPGRGLAFSTKSVSTELLSLGIRRRARNGSSGFTRGGNKAAVAAVVTSGGSSKWDVLRSIDDCADFKPATKKALIHLLMQEIYS